VWRCGTKPSIVGCCTAQDSTLTRCKPALLGIERVERVWTRKVLHADYNVSAVVLAVVLQRGNDGLINEVFSLHCSALSVNCNIITMN